MTDYFDLVVSLMDVSPKLWRRFLIRANATFMDLHYAIQDACGWTNSHLFAFRTGKRETIAGLPDDEGFGDPDPDAARVRLSSFFKTGGLRKCQYEYDFGDSWEHEVALKEIVQLPDRFERKLIDGGRAFPPEDCGGLPGYEDCVRVAQGYEGETVVGDAAELREWLGAWDPEDFDLERTRKTFDG